MKTILGSRRGAAAVAAVAILAVASVPSTLGFAPATAGFSLRGGSASVNRMGKMATLAGLRMASSDAINNGKSWNAYVKEGMEAPATGARQPEGPLEDDPTLAMVEDVILAVDERKGENIWAARVAHLTYTTSFFVNVEGTSRPMLQAIAANVEEMMSEKHGREIKWQGNPDSGWILLDYGDVIVNILTAAARKYYDLEGLWKNGELIPMDHLITPNSMMESPDSGFEDADWGTSDPFSKWDDWDEANDLSPAERDLVDRD